MRLYPAHIDTIGAEIVRALSSANDIETARPKEVERDIAAVLKQYLADEKKVNDRTKELLERTGRGHGEFQRVRAQIAESTGIRVGDEALDYLLDQVLGTFQNSANVEEIFAEDIELRRKMAPIFRKYMQVDDELDQAIRAQMKHLREGTREWDIEYQRVGETVRRRKGL